MNTTPNGPATSATLRDRTPLIIAAVFALLHLALLIFIDASNADVFVRADRAATRLTAVLDLLASPSWDAARQYLASHGIVGDYAAHALLYSLGGRFMVIAVQIVLCLASGACVYSLGRSLGLNRRMSAFAMTMYLCMPHVLVFPHQLASEALHMPLLVISTWLLATGVLERRWRPLVVSALCLGIATLIRPITLLWPFVAALIVGLAARPRFGAGYAAFAMVPVLLWMSFIGASTGEFGLGKSDHSMGRNLYERVGRIVDTLPAEQQTLARAEHLAAPDRTLGALDYLRFSMAYPAASLRHLGHDATAFFGKSGVERLTIDYLQMTSNPRALQDPRNGWRQQLERYGWGHTLQFLWDTMGPVLGVSVLGAAVIAALFVLAAIGAVHFLRHLFLAPGRPPEAWLGTLLVFLVAYIFVFSQVLNAMQSRQRAPAEFAVVLLAAAGWQALRNRSRQRAPFSPLVTHSRFGWR